MKKQKKSQKKGSTKVIKETKKMENLKIGITLGLKSNTESIWTNGIKQNVLMLVHLLKNSKKNYQVCILNTYESDFTTKPKYLKDIDIYGFNDKFMEMDLIIAMGAQVSDESMKKFKESGDKRVVSYKCGNNYILAMEDILFKEGDTLFEIEQEVNEVWYIPQQHETNAGFYTTLHRKDAIMVPFVWHQKFIYESVVEIEKGFREGRYSHSWKYEVGREKKRIGILEPNLNVVKFCLIPTMLVEESYRTPIGKEKIEKLSITNALQLGNNKKFMSMIRTFDMFKDGKIFAESRYQTAYILTQFLDILVCHQLLNPLNYLYLDAAFLGYPVLHNATLCKDLGYYYEGSDTKEGAKMLNWILENHDNNIDEYNSKNDLVLQRYHADNEDIVKTYDMLIENLWKDGNSKLVYNPNTNLYN
jgi:hypothetical protein